MVRKALAKAANECALKAGRLPDIIIDRPKKEGFGDFSTNIAMLLAPLEHKPPRDIAAEIAAGIAEDPLVEKCEVAGPGFINIFLKNTFYLSVLDSILKKGGRFGAIDVGRGLRIQVEFVSANPTGPLHIGHGRGAAVGDSLANILKAAGYDVTKEYYINDAGRQVETLGKSVKLRMKEIETGEPVEFPADFYKGDYVKEIARDYIAEYNVPGAARATPTFQEFACEAMLERIKRDLSDFRIEFDVWQSERELHDKGFVMSAIEALKGKGVTRDEEGALWFKTTELGDDKDRVLIKADKELTYFASDVAYHKKKVENGYDLLIDVWGADHHGYEGRIRAALKAFGHDDAVLKIIFIQLVALLRNGVPVPMGKREGEFVTLRQVMDEVGVDACRFFFLMRRPDAHLDFDLDLAKSQAPENPVYYVQYCHARINSIIGFAAEKGIAAPDKFDLKLLERLNQKEETEIIKHLGSFEEVVERAALNMEPHRVTFYLMELAGLFHPYYNRNRVVTDDAELTEARLLLCRAVATVAANGLRLLGVSAPEKM
ncbi:MAG: arginine--tRNA ligase [Deltaproteobacteria bacterium]